MRFNLDSVDNVRFLSIPWELFKNPKYAGLDAMSKILYGCLKSRMNLSKINHWVEENGDIFFFMRLDELAQQMGTVKSTICKKLKELEAVGLLERHSCSWSRCHKMYLHQVEAVNEDIQDKTSVATSNAAPAVSYPQNSNFVSCGKLKVSADEIEVSCEKPIYNNKEIQEKNIKSINNNNREVYSDNVDVENFNKTASEPLESIGKFFRKIGIAAHTVERILVKYTAKRLQEVIDILNMQTDVRNRAGFIVAALQFNYQFPGSRHSEERGQRDSQEYNTDNAKKQCQYVVEERPEFVETPEIISGVIDTIEALFKRRGSIFKLYEDWLTDHDLALVDGKVVAIA